MSDLFHADIPPLFLRKCFEVMLKVDRHHYQILTKRPSRAARFVRENSDLFTDGALPDHIWLGTSVEDQDVAYRIDHLLQIPTAVRFLSCEPLLGPLSLLDPLARNAHEALHWVIVGGESGPGARPLEATWVRALRDECAGLKIPFFFKQWGGLTPKAGGRELDGVTWDEYPDVALAGA